MDQEGDPVTDSAHVRLLPKSNAPAVFHIRDVDFEALELAFDSDGVWSPGPERNPCAGDESCISDSILLAQVYEVAWGQRRD